MPTIKFTNACIKTLSLVEASRSASNQHEINGVLALRQIFGDQRQERIVASFAIRGTNVTCNGNVTWYDARENHATRSEFRLYFQSNPVMEQASEGDNLIIGYDENQMLHFILIKHVHSTNKFGQWTQYNGV